MEDVEEKLKELREQYRKYPERRKSIELQARVLQFSETLSDSQEEQREAEQILKSLTPREPTVINGYIIPE